MLRPPVQKIYVPTKKDSIPALQNPYLNRPRFPRSSTACARHLELTPLPSQSTLDVDGRCLQVPTAECWEFLLPTTRATASSKTADHSKQHPAQITLDPSSTQTHLLLLDLQIPIHMHQTYTGCLIKAISRGSMAASMEDQGAGCQ